MYVCVCQTEEEFFNVAGESQENDMDIEEEEEEEEDKSEQDEDDNKDQIAHSAKGGQKSMSRNISSEKIHSLRNMVQTLKQQGTWSGMILRGFLNKDWDSYLHLVC